MLRALCNTNNQKCTRWHKRGKQLQGALLLWHGAAGQGEGLCTQHWRLIAIKMREELSLAGIGFFTDFLWTGLGGLGP